MKYARTLLGSLAALALMAANIASADSRDSRESEAEAPSTVSYWTVTDAVFKPENQHLTIQHIVPLSDMAAYGNFTNIMSDGLRLDLVDAQFAQADIDLNEPHFHFTQSFTTPD